MPGSAKRKGVQRECEVMNWLKELPKVICVTRSAGSHSSFDLIAIEATGPQERAVNLVQVKSWKPSRAMIKDLERLAGHQVYCYVYIYNRQEWWRFRPHGGYWCVIQSPLGMDTMSDPIVQFNKPAKARNKK